MEELKGRYYSVARQLLAGREGGEAQCAHHPLVRHPYSLTHERDRRAGLGLLLARSAQQVRGSCGWGCVCLQPSAAAALGLQLRCARACHACACICAACTALTDVVHAAPPPVQDAEEDAVLERAKGIEQRRRSAAARRPSSAGGGSRAGGSKPSSVLDELAAVGAAGGWGDMAGGGARGGPAPVVSSMEYTQPGQPTPQGACSLLTADLTPLQPSAPGAVLARGVHTRETGAAQMLKVPGGPRTAKLVESTVHELGVPPLPRMPTRAVCGAWLSLRAEVVSMLNLKRQLTHRQGNEPGAAGLGPRKKSKTAGRQY